VDDNEFNIMALESIIKENFHAEIHTATNGQMAVEAYIKAYEKECNCDDSVYKLIFMDINMPVMNGINATREILEYLKNQLVKNHQDVPMSRNDEDQEPTRIVALTANSDDKTNLDCKNVGMKAVYNKPMQFETLHHIMWLDFFRLPLNEYKTVYQNHFKKPLIMENMT
jgi:CheY-like chemotaxis protein